MFRGHRRAVGQFSTLTRKKVAFLKHPRVEGSGNFLHTKIGQHFCLQLFESSWVSHYLYRQEIKAGIIASPSIEKLLILEDQCPIGWLKNTRAVVDIPLSTVSRQSQFFDYHQGYCRPFCQFCTVTDRKWQHIDFSGIATFRHWSSKFLLTDWYWSPDRYRLEKLGQDYYRYQ